MIPCMFQKLKKNVLGAFLIITILLLNTTKDGSRPSFKNIFLFLNLHIKLPTITGLYSCSRFFKHSQKSQAAKIFI